MFKLRTIAIFLTSFVLSLFVGTQVYAQTSSQLFSRQSMSAMSGAEGSEFIYQNAVSTAKNIVETPVQSSLTLQVYGNNPGLWGG
jgi:hypothetical protein